MHDRGKLEKGYNAYLCMKEENEAYSWSVEVCTETEVEHGTKFIWKLQKAYEGHWPLWPLGMQHGSHGTEGIIWNWVWTGV